MGTLVTKDDVNVAQWQVPEGMSMKICSNKFCKTTRCLLICCKQTMSTSIIFRDELLCPARGGLACELFAQTQSWVWRILPTGIARTTSVSCPFPFTFASLPGRHLCATHTSSWVFISFKGEKLPRCLDNFSFSKTYRCVHSGNKHSHKTAPELFLWIHLKFSNEKQCKEDLRIWNTKSPCFHVHRCTCVLSITGQAHVFDDKPSFADDREINPNGRMKIIFYLFFFLIRLVPFHKQSVGLLKTST